MSQRRTSAPMRTGLAAAGVGLAAFLVYMVTLAPGLTWSHQGADGGELVTAAVVNGVPHPPGYPLYILLLQGWFGLTHLMGPGADLNWRGALLSAGLAAFSAAVTVFTVAHLLREQRHKLVWAALAGCAWAVSPLLWTQAVIAEVYTLHALLLVLLGWAVLVKPQRLWYAAVAVALGVANHLTIVLLLPAAYYVLWVQRRQGASAPHRQDWLVVGIAMLLGLVLGALFYVRIPLAASGTPPVNWGYADNWEGFWWLVSGAAYRGYLFASPAGSLITRLASWAYTITAQYTPFGLALALVGLAHWDRTAGYLRNFSLLWVIPISAYAVAYYTRDSDIYLLPVGWMMVLWLAVGLAQVEGWLVSRAAQRRRSWPTWLLGALAAGALFGSMAWRWPGISLADDMQARTYLQEVKAVLEPNSIVVTLEDRETFAIWYGVWGSGELAEVAPGLTPLNESLYQFDWYRRLQGDLYPSVPGIDQSVDAVIAANRGQRPIFFAQMPTDRAPAEVTEIGPLWRLNE